MSWVRHEDIHVLTVGRLTFTNDERFEAMNKPGSDVWSLRIKYPQLRDSGKYECQVSTRPPRARVIILNVVGKYLPLPHGICNVISKCCYYPVSSLVWSIRFPVSTS